MRFTTLVMILAAVQGAETDRALLDLLEKHFSSVPVERRVQYARSLSAAIPAGLDPARRASLLASLPSSLDYHADVVEGYRHLPVKVDVPEEFLREGYDLQVRYLGTRLARWASMDSTPLVRTRIEAEIGALTDGMAAILREKLPGETGRAVVEKDMAKFRRQLIETLNMPLQEFIDRPLGPAELDAVIAGVRDKLQFREPVLLAEGDLTDPGALGRKGVPALLADARQAAYGACARCFRDFTDLDRQSSEWSAKLKAKIEASFQTAAAAKDIPPRPASAGGPAVSRVDPPGAVVPARAPAPVAPRVIEDRRPDVPDHRMKIAFAVVGLLAAGVLLRAAIRARRAPNS